MHTTTPTYHTYSGPTLACTECDIPQHRLVCILAPVCATSPSPRRPTYYPTVSILNTALSLSLSLVHHRFLSTSTQSICEHLSLNVSHAQSALRLRPFAILYYQSINRSIVRGVCPLPLPHNNEYRCYIPQPPFFVKTTQKQKTTSLCLSSSTTHTIRFFLSCSCDTAPIL